MIRTLATFFLFAAALPGRALAAADPQALLSEMKAATDRLSGYTVHQLKRERIGDTLLPAESMTVKIQRGRTYLHVLSGPREGAEALYVPGWNQDKVRIHKGSFPDVTLNLDPHGSLLMDGQHHPIEHASFGHLVGTLLANLGRARATGEGKLRVAGETVVQGRPADVLEMTSPWRTSRYVVQRGEDAWAVARKHNIDAYVLLHENGLKRPGALSAGMEVQVPAYYGSRTVLAIDRESHLPARLEVYDGKGRLYELYEWSQLDTRTALTDLDFSPESPEYHF